MKIPEIYQGFGYIEDLVTQGYKKRDILAAMKYCAKMEGMDQGDELVLFLEGINYGKKEEKQKILSLIDKQQTYNLDGSEGCGIDKDILKEQFRTQLNLTQRRKSKWQTLEKLQRTMFHRKLLI